MIQDPMFVLLRDADGNAYAVPWDVLERSKLPTAVGSALAATDDEVTGNASAFFHGRVLSVADFSNEQTYLRGKRFDLNQHLKAVRMKPGGGGPDDD